MSDDQRDHSLPPEYAVGLRHGDGHLAADDSEPAPSGLFEKILARIDEAGMHLAGTTTKRAVDAEWRHYSEGIVFRVLKVDEGRRRQTLLVKMQPGARYQRHSHDIDEGWLVIEGDLRYGDLVLRAGDYHLATSGALHLTGTTTAGCLLHVVVGMEI